MIQVLLLANSISEVDVGKFSPKLEGTLLMLKRQYQDEIECQIVCNDEICVPMLELLTKHFYKKFSVYLLAPIDEYKELLMEDSYQKLTQNLEAASLVRIASATYVRKNIPSTYSWALRQTSWVLSFWNKNRTSEIYPVLKEAMERNKIVLNCSPDSEQIELVGEHQEFDLTPLFIKDK